jgi:hypothetical protein
MMKKLLVLMLVLAMGGLASAGLMLDVNQATGEIAVLVAEGPNLITFDLEISVDGGTLNAAGANINPSGKAWHLAPKIATQTETSFRATGGDFPMLGGLGLGAAETVVSGLVVAPPPAGCWVILSSYGSDMGDGSALTGELARVFVPEPMSMMLLGLGGLFLRRRK